MRPPPFILVLKSNAPGSSETAITKGGRIMFREKKSGAEMENMAALWTSVFWSRPSPARAPQRRHPGLLGPPVPCIQSSHTGRHRGSTAGFLFLVCKGTAAFSFSADKVGPGFRPEIAGFPAAPRPTKSDRRSACPPKREESVPRRGHRFPVAVIRREGRMQGCKALSWLHSYTLAPADASTTDFLAFLR